MKRYSLILNALAVLCTTTAFAQTWCAPGATWVYYQYGSMVSLGGSAKYAYEGDTLLDGYTGQRISVFSRQTIQLPWEDTATVYETWHEDEVTRTEPGIVYLWLRDLAEWDTLYWFSAEVGDRWTPGWHQYLNESCEATGYLEVISVETNWDVGIPVRKLTLAQYHNGEQYQDLISVAERIGNTAGCWIPRPPGWWCGVFQESGCEFRCYSDQDAFYTPWPDFIESCAYSITGVEQQPLASGVPWSVFPVPFRDRITIHSATSPTTHVVLLELRGRVLLRKSFNGSVLQVDAGHLAPGCYVLQLTNDQGTQMHRAVIKQ